MINGFVGVHHQFLVMYPAPFVAMTHIKSFEDDRTLSLTQSRKSTAVDDSYPVYLI